jgi:hypothetical protein
MARNFQGSLPMRCRPTPPPASHGKKSSRWPPSCWPTLGHGRRSRRFDSCIPTGQKRAYEFASLPQRLPIDFARHFVRSHISHAARIGTWRSMPTDGTSGRNTPECQSISTASISSITRSVTHWARFMRSAPELGTLLRSCCSKLSVYRVASRTRGPTPTHQFPPQQCCRRQSRRRQPLRQQLRQRPNS